jgi:hypothetical protein
MSVFGDHNTPHRQPTNANFDNKPLMKKGQNKRGGTANADDHGNTLGVASAWRRPTVFRLNGTQFSTMYSIQYGCLGRQSERCQLLKGFGEDDNDVAVELVQVQALRCWGCLPSFDSGATTTTAKTYSWQMIMKKWGGCNRACTINPTGSYGGRDLWGGRGLWELCNGTTPPPKGRSGTLSTWTIGGRRLLTWLWWKQWIQSWQSTESSGCHAMGGPKLQTASRGSALWNRLPTRSLQNDWRRPIHMRWTKANTGKRTFALGGGLTNEILWEELCVHQYW